MKEGILMNAKWTIVIGIYLFVGVAVAFAQDEPRKRPAQEQKRKRPEAAQKFDPARMLEQYDKNKDGFLDATELPERIKGRIDQFDSDKDGKLSRAELEKLAARAGAQPARPEAEAKPDLFRLLDANNDGKLSKEELQNAPRLLEKLDRNKDGVLDQEELKAAPAKKQRPAGRPGEVITPAAKAERQKDQLKVGDLAPDFTLPELKGSKEVTLSSFRGKKPVVLIFASYT